MISTVFVKDGHKIVDCLCTNVLAARIQAKLRTQFHCCPNFRTYKLRKLRYHEISIRLSYLGLTSGLEPLIMLHALDCF